MSADIESCKLVNLQLVKSEFDSGIAPEEGSQVELQLKYKVDFGLPVDPDGDKFSLKINAGLKAASPEDGGDFFSAESQYLCTYLVDGGEGIELEEYAQFSEQLGKRIYLTVRDRLMNLLSCGDRTTFLPYDLPPRKNNEADDGEVGDE